MRIGIFSSFIEPAAFELVRHVINAVRTGEIPDSEIAFIFSNRGFSESEILSHRLTPELMAIGAHPPDVITSLASTFEPEIRRQAKKLEREGDPTLINEWRNQFAEAVLERIPSTDIDVLLGDMYIWGDKLCDARKGINLHPALPDGPKGEWYKVIWELIRTKSQETGVLMHKVTRELDRGPVVTYCHFPIIGPAFDHLWRQLPEDRNELSAMIQRGLVEKELAQHPLHREIRSHGLTREFPLIIQTLRALAEGKIRFEGESVIDNLGNPLEGGFDLTPEIDKIVRPILEGQLAARKEVR